MNSHEQRHLEAMAHPRGVERAHVALYSAVKAVTAQGWDRDGYADDYVADLVLSARALLNMDSGRLDRAALDAFYVAILRGAGLEV